MKLAEPMPSPARPARSPKPAKGEYSYSERHSKSHQERWLDVNNYPQLDSLSMLGVCVGAGAELVDPVVEEGLTPELEVAVLPA